MILISSQSVTRFQPCLICVVLAGIAWVHCGSFAALAQNANPPASSPAAIDPKTSASQLAFERLPEAERKAIQSDLVWAGDFTGGNSGGFGPLTLRAINNFKSRSGAVADGILSASDRKSLANAAKAARDAVSFQIMPDARTGSRIGIPLSVLPKKDVTPSGGSRWQSADGRVTLDTRNGQKGDTLPLLFEKATSGTTPGRKVTYKLLRTDFYVVSGETSNGKFYSRMASGPDGLRGFAIGYDKALAEMVDPLVIAVANSFEPFPAIMAAPSSAASTATAISVAGKPPAIPPSSLGVGAPPHPPRERNGAGLIVANGLVLTAKAAVADCKTLKVGVRLAKLRLQNDADSLALLDVEGVMMQASPKLALAEPAASDTVLVMSFGDGAHAALNAPPSAVVFQGHVVSTAPLSISAPLQPGGAGAVAYDRHGAIVGLATANPSGRYLVAGIAPERAHVFATRSAISALLQNANVTLATSPAEATLTSGAVTQAAMGQIVSISCLP